MVFVVTVFAHLPNKILFENVYVTKVVEDGTHEDSATLAQPEPHKKNSFISKLFTILHGAASA